MIDVFSFPPGVYVETLNLIASIPGLSILTFHDNKYLTKTYDGKKIFFSEATKPRVFIVWV